MNFIFLLNTSHVFLIVMIIIKQLSRLDGLYNDLVEGFLIVRCMWPLPKRML